MKKFILILVILQFLVSPILIGQTNDAIKPPFRTIFNSVGGTSAGVVMGFGQGYTEFDGNFGRMSYHRIDIVIDNKYSVGFVYNRLKKPIKFDSGISPDTAYYTRFSQFGIRICYSAYSDRYTHLDFPIVLGGGFATVYGRSDGTRAISIDNANYAITERSSYILVEPGISITFCGEAAIRTEIGIHYRFCIDPDLQFINASQLHGPILKAIVLFGKTS